MIDKDGLAALSKLGEELAWLEANKPSFTHTIELVKSHLKTIKMAGGCRSGSINLPRGGCSDLPQPKRGLDPRD